MQLSRRHLLAAGAAAATLRSLPFSTARAQVAAASPADAAAQRTLSAITEALLVDMPEQASSLGIDTGARAALKSRLPNRSLGGRDAIRGRLTEHVAALERIDLAPLSPATRIDVDVTRTSLASALDGLAFPFGDVAVGGWRNTPYIVIQNVGGYIDVPRMLDSDHKVETRADAEAYLARLDAFAGLLDGETERLKRDGAAGVVAPDFLLDKGLGQLRQTRAGPVSEWGMVTSLARRTTAIPGDWAKRATAIADAKIAPALDRQLAELTRHRARATADAGVWKLPQGDAYYAWALSAATTTRRTPDEVHAQGLDELKRLQAEMDTLLRAQGYTQGSVGARMIAIGRDPRFQFPATDAGRAEIIAYLENRIADMRERVPRAFTKLVPGRVEVRRLPLAEEAGAAGAYGGPGSIDGTVPGKLWINLANTGDWPRYALPTLAYHEAMPGHVWQGEYTFKLPLIRSILGFNAYSEGWALYAEQLGNELGAYDADPVGRLGYLQSLAFRACRLVVDTGLHAKRWTRAQAIEWFTTTNGSGIDEVSREVDRYCSWPGQACGYKVGHSEIVRLRAKAQAALGQRFDVRLFNDAVVGAGGVPLTVLERVVDAHVAARRA